MNQKSTIFEDPTLLIFFVVVVAKYMQNKIFPSYHFFQEVSAVSYTCFPEIHEVFLFCLVLMEAGKNGDNGWITAKGEVAVGRGWVLITGEVEGV